MSGSRWIALGAISAGLAVGAGAFAAHGLKDVFEDDALKKWLPIFETGAHYHLVHSLAVILIGVLIRQRPDSVLTIAGWAFVVGIVLFSGSLYTLVLTQVSRWGAVTPFGGVAFLVGWLFMAISGLRPHGARVSHSSLSVTIERP